MSARPCDMRKKPRIRVAGKYGWLAIHLFMRHLSEVAMATPIISEAIVKLSNEKIRKYHLSRLLRNSLAFYNVRSLSPRLLLLSRRSLSTLFIPLPLPSASTTMVGTTMKPSGGYQRLPEMVPLVDW